MWSKLAGLLRVSPRAPRHSLFSTVSVYQSSRTRVWAAAGVALVGIAAGGSLLAVESPSKKVLQADPESVKV